MTKPPANWGLTAVETACVLDCPDSCSLSVRLERGRVAQIEGSRANGVTNGFICAKVRGFADRVYGTERLMYPMRRNGPKGRGAFTRISWDEAMSAVAGRLDAVRREHGGEAILPFSYGGSNGLLTQGTADADLFASLGASRLARTVCAAATGAATEAMYGKMTGVAYADYPHAKLIVVWGANPSSSGIHLIPYIKEARKNGARVVVVDPRRTPLAKSADLHLRLRPGTDVVVALALIRFLFESGHADERFLAEHTTGSLELRAAASPWTFERAAAESGVAVDDISRFAELYAMTSPALIRCGWGLERNRNGGHAVMAVLALPAVAGKFGVRGGGYTLSNSGAWNLPTRAWREVADPPTRVINMNRLGRSLTETFTPPIKALFVYNANPVATLPDQASVCRGLSRDDLFTVVFDQVITDTAAYADIVLPATTFLETYDLAKGYGSLSLQLVKPVIDAVGESRPNGEVFSELAMRLGFRGEMETEAETLVRVAAALPASIAEPLLDGGQPTPPGGATPIQFVDVMPNTPDARAHLYPRALHTNAPEGLYSYRQVEAPDIYPLTLISPATEKTISSTLGELRRTPAVLYMHIEDGHVRGLTDGDTVRVFNALGEVQCPVMLGDGIAPGTISLPKGLWRKSTLNQWTTNALVPDTFTDLGDGACFNDARVEVAKVVAVTFEKKAFALFVPHIDDPQLH